MKEVLASSRTSNWALVPFVSNCFLLAEAQMQSCTEWIYAQETAIANLIEFCIFTGPSEGSQGYHIPSLLTHDSQAPKLQELRVGRRWLFIALSEEKLSTFHLIFLAPKHPDCVNLALRKQSSNRF
jgi:hypothetical protein